VTTETLRQLLALATHLHSALLSSCCCPILPTRSHK